jgi:hypothetical protein
MSLRDDPELGAVRLCGACGEEWPFDSEFWHLRNGVLDKNWPRRCIACCSEYHAQRRRLAQRIERHQRRAIAPKEGRCGAAMRSHQRCGRQMGHPYGHRSVTAMRVDAARKRQGRAA